MPLMRGIYSVLTQTRSLTQPLIRLHSRSNKLTLTTVSTSTALTQYYVSTMRTQY